VGAAVLVAAARKKRRASEGHQEGENP